MVEFSLVFGLFFVSLIACLESGIFWAQESIGATHAAEIGANIASQVYLSPTSEVSATSEVWAAIQPALDASMIATPVQEDLLPVGGTCPTSPDQVPGPPHILVCITTNSVTPTDSFASVVVVGNANAVFGIDPFGFSPGIPIYAASTVKILTFTP
jgi:hypothetical protein